MPLLPLPSLTNFESTAIGLHKAAQLLGVLKMVRLPHVAHYLEVALKVVPDGLSTDVLPGGSEAILDLRQSSLVVRVMGTSTATIPLAGQTQAAVLKALLNALKTSELKDIVKETSDETLVEQFLAELTARKYDVTAPHNAITGTEALAIDRQLAQDYARSLYSIFTAMARFHARLNGPMTPAVVWPGHFDLSFLWFATDKTEGSSPHLNFGFSPYGGGVDQPYLYSYAYPMPSAPGSKLPDLPSGAHWHTEGWTGVVLPYSAIAAAADSEAFVEEMCGGIYRALRPLLG